MGTFAVEKLLKYVHYALQGAYKIDLFLKVSMSYMLIFAQVLSQIELNHIVLRHTDAT